MSEYLCRVLVVSRQTADSDDLLSALRDRAERGPIRITLLVPAPSIGVAGRDAGQAVLDAALAKLRDAGLDADGMVGDHDPVEAVVEAWRPGAYDEVVVTTLPGVTSPWMQMDFPHRVAKLCDCHVTHVVARPAGDAAAPAPGPPPAKEPQPLGPLSVLAWGRAEA